jgi:thiamine-phosphate pyrophosphorylase
MTPIMTTLIDRFIAGRLYAITCSPSNGVAGYEAMARAACEGGVDILQFRDKILSWKDRFEVAQKLRKVCSEFNVLFIVNDATDLALAAQADGVHVGQDDLPLSVVQELVRQSGRNNFLIGKSTHSLDQAVAAEREGADYIGIGPVFATPTKPTYGAVGLELVRQVTQAVKTPHVAIGGIDGSNVKSVLEAGATRVAIVRAVCGASDIRAAAQALKANL